ncbi:extracellular calcium-sensing receptor-like [Solea senegalensis]|uniref:Extracellular calcium-sensing receptor-like n=1 Tax=Solea senegalensis TaxID=28829 RepID=A0AAV6QV35_SOLSE|nr:extracellular calcium-sensing receptor-like [Solea senegalensis]
MWTFLDTCTLFLRLFSCFSSAVSSSLYSSSCHLQGQFNLNGMHKTGDVILGGIFKVHFTSTYPDLSLTSEPQQPECYGFDVVGFRQAQTMAFAIDEINRNSNLLPSVTLGYSLYDNCEQLGIGFRAALTLVSGQEEQVTLEENCVGTPPVLGVVGDTTSSSTIAISTVLGLYRVPLVSYFATCSCLSDRQKFPSFFRTIPSDDFQVNAMIQILKHFGWTWAGLLISSDDYGVHAARSFHSDLSPAGGGCLAYTEILPWGDDPAELRRIVDVMRKSTARVVIVFAHQIHMIQLMVEVVRQNVTGLQWIASEAWSSLDVLQTPHLMPYLGGTLGIAIRRGEIPGLSDFLLRIRPDLHHNNTDGNSMVNQFWEHTFQCRFAPPPAGWVEAGGELCTGQEVIENVENELVDVSNLRPEYNVYKAVYALAYALDDMLQCEPGRGPFSNSTCAHLQRLEPWQGQFNLNGMHKTGDVILGGIFKVHFTSTYPILSLTSEPQQPGCYGFDIIGFRQAQTMAFAIDEINRNSNLLPNVTLGYSLHDNCNQLGIGFRAALTLVSGQEEQVTLQENCVGTPPVLGVVGDTTSSSTIAISTVIGLYRVPLVNAMIQILKHFGWTWAGLLISDDDYGVHVARSFHSDLGPAGGGCLAYTEILPWGDDPAELRRIVDVMRKSTARVVIVFAHQIHMIQLMVEVVRQNVTGLQWIASEAWSSLDVLQTPHLMPYLGGTLGIAIRRGEIPGLSDFLLQIHPDLHHNNTDGNSMVNQFWEHTFQCRFAPPPAGWEEAGGELCTGQEILENVETEFFDISNLMPEYNVYKAVYALAYALDDMLQCEPGRGPFSNNTCAHLQRLEPWQGQFYLNGMHKTGDVIVGGLFTVHFISTDPDLSFSSEPQQSQCYSFDIIGFRQAQTMAFAIDEINRNSNLLPNVTLGYSLYDNCLQLGIGFRAALTLVSGQEEQVTLEENCVGTPPVVGIVGDSSSSSTVAISTILGLYRVPLVNAMIQILKHFGWTWAGLLISDDDYGVHVARSFHSDLGPAGGGCLAYTEILPWGDDPAELRRIVDVMRKSTARVVIVFAYKGHMINLMKEVVRQNVTGLQWIASEAWSSVDVLQTPHLMPYLGGTLGISIRRGEIPGLRDFLLQICPDLHHNNTDGNSMVNQFWEHTFQCRFAPPPAGWVEAGGELCTGQEVIENVETEFLDVSNLMSEYNVYKAVYALAYALDDMLQCEPGRGPFSNNTCAHLQRLEPWQGPFYLNGIHKTGDVIVGGLFTLHFISTDPDLSFTSEPQQPQCYSLDIIGFRQTQTMAFAIDEINRNSNLLPNVTLGYSLYDNCLQLGIGFRGALTLVSGQEEEVTLEENCAGTPPVLGIVGDSFSSSTVAISTVLGLYRMPLVNAMIQILKHFGWTWAGLIISDDDYGVHAARSFHSDLGPAGGGCLAYTEILPWDDDSTELRRIVDVIRKSTARVVIVFSNKGLMVNLMKEVVRQHVTGLQWIASEAWSSFDVIQTPHLPYLGGSLGISIRRGEIPGLRDFLLQIRPDLHHTNTDGNSMVNQFWEHTFQCRIAPPPAGWVEAGGKLCTGQEVIENVENELFDISNLRSEYNVYKAVYALAYALDDMLQCEPGRGPFSNNTCAHLQRLEPWQVRY